jgi:hypothetical protein
MNKLLSSRKYPVLNAVSGIKRFILGLYKTQKYIVWKECRAY